ncbi:peptide deformylase 1A, chloroplastic isoform X2 [Amborella trichopoda]|nr:peptide deformylase 1A, chloroplastic isoform X2 [Amborella trichopoda]|eukprot:XP_006842848.2 peptide deformylase 1A, chloroplastic isoform X2 [Amborella trichopoda]
MVTEVWVTMESIFRLPSWLLSLSTTRRAFTKNPHHNTSKLPLCNLRHPFLKRPPLDFTVGKIPLLLQSTREASSLVSAGWFQGLTQKKMDLPDIVKAGDPVLHEPALDIASEEIGSEKIQKIIEDMIQVMRKAPGVGLAAPQIGIPLKIIVLEDTETYINYAPKEETNAQQREPFDLLVIINPKLTKKGNKSALFFEGCLSVDGFRALVERYLEVEVIGLGRDGCPIKVNAIGWKARILQHECDHLDGTIYVDKMVPRTFRTVENLDLPLPSGCPKLGVQ